MPDSYEDYVRAMAYRNSPEYAWQQQLASGANLAKNLNWQTLLGLTIGTGLGNWLGNKFWNWQRARDDALQYSTNPVAINSAVHNALIPQGEADLGWRPQYQFPTANKLISDQFTPNIDWRQNLRQNFPWRPTPTVTPTVPTPTTTPSTAIQSNVLQKKYTPPSPLLPPTTINDPFKNGW